jgi:hypothetical protein
MLHRESDVKKEASISEEIELVTKGEETNGRSLSVSPKRKKRYNGEFRERDSCSETGEEISDFTKYTSKNSKKKFIWDGSLFKKWNGRLYNQEVDAYVSSVLEHEYYTEKNTENVYEYQDLNERLYNQWTDAYASLDDEQSSVSSEAESPQNISDLFSLNHQMLDEELEASGSMINENIIWENGNPFLNFCALHQTSSCESNTTEEIKGSLMDGEKIIWENENPFLTLSLTSSSEVEIGTENEDNVEIDLVDDSKVETKI